VSLNAAKARRPMETEDAHAEPRTHAAQPK